MSVRLKLAVLSAVLACAACSTAPAPTAPVVTPEPVAPPSVSEVAPQPRPVRVAVAAREIDGPVMVEGLGLDAAGGHEEPPVEEPGLGSWYNLGPRPGAVGPAVILGHVNGRGKLGLFANLSRVRDGDRITVTREDGSSVVFVSYKTETVEKTSFPADQVYANTAGPEIRLVTCGGELDRARHRYLSNVIVFGRLAG